MIWLTFLMHLEVLAIYLTVVNIDNGRAIDSAIFLEANTFLLIFEILKVFEAE